MLNEIKRGIRYLTAGNVTKNFKWAEFDCKDGTSVPDHLKSNVKELALNLEVIREYFGGKSVTIHSGFRTISHNKKVGGVANSLHLTGRAADIRISGYTSQQVYDGILKLMNEGKITQGGLGLYSSFVHYDIRGKFVTWKG